MNEELCTERSRNILQQNSENVCLARALGEGREIEILKILDVMERMRQNWDDERLRALSMQEQIKLLEEENDKLRMEMHMYKEQLRDARAQIAAMMADKQSMEHDLADMKRKFDLASDLLEGDRKALSDEDREKLTSIRNASVDPKNNTISHRFSARRRNTRNMSNGDDIDFDKTGESGAVSYDESDESQLRSGKVFKRSRSSVKLPSAHLTTTAKRSKDTQIMGVVEEENISPCKRSKDSPETTTTTITATTTINVDPQGRRPSTAKVAIRRSMNRSMSESNVLNAQENATEPKTPYRAMTPRHGISVLDLRSPLGGVKSWTKGATIETRPHIYSGFNPIIGDRCIACNRWIGFGGKPAVKCNDCGIHVHKSCSNDAPMPCVPRTPTPRTPGKQRPRLKEFCPPTRPMIPPLIIHCVLVLEKDRLSCEGIYRIPGQESTVLKLLEEFKTGRTMPKLDNHDTETITGCIKRFLREIRDPVIPTTSWDEFVRAAEANDIEALNHSVIDLPFPNRDTLAFLCAHFQKVCENSIRNKMTPDVLARSVAPTIVGRAPVRTMNMAQNADEVAKQIMVMVTLLKMPRDYWLKLYATDQENQDLVMTIEKTPSGLASMMRTPHRGATGRIHCVTPGSAVAVDPNQSLLGPLDTPPSGQSRLLQQSSAARRRKFFGDPF